MTKKSLEFQVESCRITLHMPAAMTDMGMTNLRKLFRWISREEWRNVESICAFFSYIPEVEDDLLQKWSQASEAAAKNYRDPKFDAFGNYISDKDERNRRRAHNRRLKMKVLEARARYSSFMHRVPVLEELKKQYLR